ncbi:hypothetical protein H0H93_012522 [Arthromyces matolae]|nr:hypothetical protein H0H93_012522 [Arthromyces matolae]
MKCKHTPLSLLLTILCQFFLSHAAVVRDSLSANSSVATTASKSPALELTSEHSVTPANSPSSTTSTAYTSSSNAFTAPTSLTPSVTTSAAPEETSLDVTAQDIDTIFVRRLSLIVGSLESGVAGNISAWLSTLGTDGKWPDSEVDYTTGCTARRANWPAEAHWQRIQAMAAAWHGGLQGGDQYVGNSEQIILIPDLVGQSCVLLNGTLSSGEIDNCTRMLIRSYSTFDTNVHGLGYLTGANALDVASIGIDYALLSTNLTILTDAFRRIHLEVNIENVVKADGIRADGAFGQHSGILYNGNYGKDYTNDITGFEIEAGGTEFGANATEQAALGTLFDGDKWMIYANSLTGTLHWDFILDLGKMWSSNSLINFAKSLSQSAKNANAGSLEGNRMFFTSDYMVRTFKKVEFRYLIHYRELGSSRFQLCDDAQNVLRKNAEYGMYQSPECMACLFTCPRKVQPSIFQPFGFHLSDGTVYTYLRGDEYEDISAAWDWNLIPGTTVDYGATDLNCNQTQFTGIETFVGGVSDNRRGVAAMRYTNPYTQSLKWQKVWFFLDDDVQHVMISNITSTSSAPVYSVLDQRRHTTKVVEDQINVGGVRSHSLWHGGTGYVLPLNDSATLAVQSGKKSGNWSTIGTSTQPPFEVDLFGAWINHTSVSTPIAYTAFPGTDLATFSKKSAQLRLHTIQNDAHVSGIYDQVHDVAMIVFWDANGGSISFNRKNSRSSQAITVSADGNTALIYRPSSKTLVIADPSQTISSVNVTIVYQGLAKSVALRLPQGGLAGSSLTLTIPLP